MGSDFQKYFKLIFIYNCHGLTPAGSYPVLYVQATIQTLFSTQFHDKFVLVNRKNDFQPNFIISEIFPNGT